MTVLLSLLTGGATGLLGTLFSGVLRFFEQRAQRSHELEVLRVEQDTMALEAKLAREQSAIEAEAEERKAEWAALQGSYRQEATTLSRGDHPALVWVDVVRGLMRPLLTLTLVALAGVIYFHTDTTAPKGAELEERIVATILYLATAATLWWFGDRMASKPPGATLK